MISKFASILCLVPLVAPFRAPDHAQKDFILPVIRPSAPKVLSPQVLLDAPGATAPKFLQDTEISIKQRRATERKRWGEDRKDQHDYWYNPTIHTLGNSGFGGAVHAALAPITTKMIDVLAYEGIDVRQQVAHELSELVKSTGKARVVDLCCGVGISTRALRNAFPHAETVLGVDTSSEMISMANFLSMHLSFVKQLLLRFSSSMQNNFVCPPCTSFTRANAEDTELPARSFDLVTVMYAFHEAPNTGRHNILKEAHRLLQPGGTLAVIDICAEYTPSESMLAGEPYVLEYQKNIHKQLRSFKGFARITYKSIVPNHVGMWVMKRGAM